MHFVGEGSIHEARLASGFARIIVCHENIVNVIVDVIEFLCVMTCICFFGLCFCTSFEVMLHCMFFQFMPSLCLKIFVSFHLRMVCDCF